MDVIGFGYLGWTGSWRPWEGSMRVLYIVFWGVVSEITVIL